jgi:hypothetical protein
MNKPQSKKGNTQQMMSTEFFKDRKKLKFSVSDSPQSFSLISLHEHLLGYKPTIAHWAEANCLAYFSFSMKINHFVYMLITSLSSSDFLTNIVNCFRFFVARALK